MFLFIVSTVLNVRHTETRRFFQSIIFKIDQKKLIIENREWVRPLGTGIPEIILMRLH